MKLKTKTLSKIPNMFFVGPFILFGKYCIIQNKNYTLKYQFRRVFKIDFFVFSCVFGPLFGFRV